MSFNPYTCNPIDAYQALSQSKELTAFIQGIETSPKEQEMLHSLTTTAVLNWPLFYHNYME